MLLSSFCVEFKKINLKYAELVRGGNIVDSQLLLLLTVLFLSALGV